MRLLAWVLLAMLSCLPKLVLAAAVAPAHPTGKPQIPKTLKKSGPAIEIQRDSVEVLRAKAELSSERSGTFDGPVIAPKSEKKPSKSEPDFVESDRGKHLDRRAFETVMNFLKKEGTSRFGIADPEKDVKIVRIIPDLDFPDRRIVSVDQAFKGVPIFGARTNVEVSPEKGVVAVTSGFVPQERIVSVSSVPAISWTDAIDRALVSYRRSRAYDPQARPKPEYCAVKIDLTIFDPAQLRLKAERA